MVEKAEKAATHANAHWKVNTKCPQLWLIFCMFANLQLNGAEMQLQKPEAMADVILGFLVENPRKTREKG